MSKEEFEKIFGIVGESEGLERLFQDDDINETRLRDFINHRLGYDTSHKINYKHPQIIKFTNKYPNYREQIIKYRRDN